MRGENLILLAAKPVELPAEEEEEEKPHFLLRCVREDLVWKVAGITFSEIRIVQDHKNVS